MRIKWPPVLAHAAEIVRSYDTGVTLRQLFYRLVADQTLPNLGSYYRRLSARTAEGRRAGTFPDLLDHTSGIVRPRSFDSPEDAVGWLRNEYRRDRTEGQPWTIVLGIEKDALSELAYRWFTDPQGIAYVALGGYASQTLVDEIRRHVDLWDRPACLLYAGDHDPTGVDVERDFVARVGVFDEVLRVALTPEQIRIHNLPTSVVPEVAEKLGRDPRARGFVDQFGSLVQYELDALPPDVLRNEFRSALDRFWDQAAYERVLAAEAGDRDDLG